MKKKDLLRVSVVFGLLAGVTGCGSKSEAERSVASDPGVPVDAVPLVPAGDQSPAAPAKEEQPPVKDKGEKAKPDNPRIAKFAELDADHDGQLTLAEFSGERKGKDAHKWFARRDGDRDGFLSLGEFVPTSAAEAGGQAAPPSSASIRFISGWGASEDPAGGASLALQGTTLVITAPDAYVDNYPPGKVNAPRVLQEVVGDFTAEVKVTHLDPSKPNSVLASLGSFPTAYHAGILLVRLNDKNFIRFEKGSKNTNGLHATTCELQVWENGQRLLYAPEDIEDVAVSLRLERRGELLLSSFSKDEGKTWKRLPEHKLDKLKGAVKVGVSVTNNTEPGCTVKFQDLKVANAQNPRLVKFAELDKNRDGQLNLAEFTEDRKPEEAEKWFRQRDVDGNGLVSPLEYAPALPIGMPQ
jgi:regulation of enolase protein 1 (concanavalin A-like superfamily)